MICIRPYSTCSFLLIGILRNARKIFKDTAQLKRTMDTKKNNELQLKFQEDLFQFLFT